MLSQVKYMYNLIKDQNILRFWYNVNKTINVEQLVY